MPYLIDTCVVSELAKAEPNAKVRRFMNETPSSMAYLSCLTMGEIHKGIELLPRSARRRDLETWVEGDLMLRFSCRILSFDLAAALTWGSLDARLRQRGRTLPQVDAMIAATALVHEMKLATRNVADFDGTGVEVVNPWD